VAPSRSSATAAAAFALLLLMAPHDAESQRSLAPNSPSGQSVTPVYEGWYRNKDGTYSLSFGYFNRNTTERLELAVGDSNFVSPGAPDRGQPTHFAPRRHWGVFAVVVPADFGNKKVTWTLRNRGQTFAISGSLNPDWQIDAIEGEASSNDTPPVLRFTADGPTGNGPLGVTAGPLTVAVGKPLPISVFVTDDAKTGSTGANGTRVPTPVDLTWFKHQGPGVVTFAPATTRLAATGGTGNTTATFSKPGSYLLRVRANDSPMTSAGHSQCCWSNGFLKVTVTP
jgi:hypothetical protein